MVHRLRLRHPTLRPRLHRWLARRLARRGYIHFLSPPRSWMEDRVLPRSAAIRDCTRYIRRPYQTTHTLDTRHVANSSETQFLPLRCPSPRNVLLRAPLSIRIRPRCALQDFPPPGSAHYPHCPYLRGPARRLLLAFAIELADTAVFRFANIHAGERMGHLPPLRLPARATRYRSSDMDGAFPRLHYHQVIHPPLLARRKEHGVLLFGIYSR